MGKTNINRDIIKRDAAERRREDIAAHGKPTAFRTNITKNKKAYNRKQKHKVQLSKSDIDEMVMSCVSRILCESYGNSAVEELEKNYDSEVERVCGEINQYLSTFGLRAKFNKKYDFSGYYSDAVAVYQYRSVKRDGCMRFSLNYRVLKEFAEEEGEFYGYDAVIEQLELSLWHECAHGLMEWIKQARRLDTQRGTGIFKGERLRAIRNLVNKDEEALAEEFAEHKVFGYSSDIADFIEEYMTKKPQA